MGKKILVTSEKSNIGKSLFCVKIALELIRTGKKIVVVEFSEKNKSIAEYLELEDQIIYDLKDALDEVCDVDQAIININELFDILPTPRLKEKLENVEAGSFDKLIKELERTYDYIIIEVSKIISNYSISLQNMDSVIILNNNDFSSLSEINNDFIVASENSIKNKFIVVNKFNKSNAKKNLALSIKDYAKVFPEPILYFIKLDEKYDSLKNDYFLCRYSDELSGVIDNIAKKVG